MKKNKKSFDIFFLKTDGRTILECRQTTHNTRKEAEHEAELYKAWAECHYGCKVGYNISEYQTISSI